MLNWDYNLPKNWQPQTNQEWQWFLVRKINYNDFEGITKDLFKKYFPKIKKQLDPGKRVLLEYFIKQDEY